MLTPKEIEFIVENAKSDTSKILLGASKYPHINVKLCVNCIESRQKIATKLPNWFANTSLVYPYPLSAEQCSSEITGEYKKELISNIIKKSENLSAKKEIRGADLTGGMGVDSYFLSAATHSFHYFERNEELCNATEYNFQQLGIENISVHNLEVNSNNISELPGAPYDFIFIDPARRSKSNKDSKVISLQDYEPNIVELKEELFKIASTILVKVSPMADIKLNLGLLPETEEIHIVAVDNECKELLFVLKADKYNSSNKIYTKSAECNNHINITAVNLSSKGKEYQHIKYTPEQEENAQPHLKSEVGKYLYEPNKAVLKAGIFKLISQQFKCSKLAISTHLYTSDELIEKFPGKIYTVEKTVPFNKKTIKEIAAQNPHADLSARNFPLDTNALKKLSGIKDGGVKHLFATTLNNGEKVVIIANINK